MTSSLGKHRRRARRLALDALYQAEIRDQLPSEALSLLQRQGWNLDREGDATDSVTAEAPSESAVLYATILVNGVQANESSIDRVINEHAEHWTIRRMPVVDRNLLRLAVFELIWEPSVPVAVVINEAVELANSLSTEESGRFINGVLGRLAEDRGDDAQSLS